MWLNVLCRCSFPLNTCDSLPTRDRQGLVAIYEVLSNRPERLAIN
jgi:hypothetical protein